jgi:hypothetical protein
MVGNLYETKNEQQKFMEFRPVGKARGSISFKSGDRPDNLRGVGLDFVVMDEAAFIPRAAWFNVIRPALSDKLGEALIISTPNGVSNWFYQAYLWGQDKNERYSDWESWRFPSTVNPHMPPGEVLQAQATMPDLEFRQEYLADFVSDAAGVFRGLDEIATLRPLAGPRSDFTYVAGVDWARKNDFTVISIFEVETGNQADIVRFTDVGFEIQKMRLKTEHAKWKFRKIFPESNAISMAVVEALETDPELDGVIYPITMTNPMKTQLVEKLAVNIERGLIHLIAARPAGEGEEYEPYHAVGELQLSELRAFELQRTRGNSITYGAPRGTHDDMVIAAMLANEGIVGRKHRILQQVGNPFYGGVGQSFASQRLNTQLMNIVRVETDSPADLNTYLQSRGFKAHVVPGDPFHEVVIGKNKPGVLHALRQRKNTKIIADFLERRNA